ncbi:MAG: TIGR03894 family protein [Cyanobacteriota bacterium]|nr:TIGR03894 family protein [Cyanobacteriota bacterium]
MADKELLREVALELWGSVKKLRPGLPRESRLELTLKALMVIGDLQDQVQAAVVVGVIAEQEPPENEPQGQDVTQTADSGSEVEQTPDGRRVVRRRSRAAG